MPDGTGDKYLFRLEKNKIGGVPEWLKGTDCKSVGYAYVGSNPTPSTIIGRGAREEGSRIRRV